MIRVKRLFLDLGEFKLMVLDLAIQKGEYLVIVGPTGSGKTLFLKSIAGICKPQEGEIWIGQNNVIRMPPEGRQVGYVPQDYKLFPHLTVEKNIAFGLRNKMDPVSMNKVKELMDLIKVPHLSKRQSIKTLSAGEKQRISLARALAIEPKVLLLDEPLSALDTTTGKKLRRELKKVHDKMGTTTIHVTHNLEEAEELANKIVIMKDGKIQLTEDSYEFKDCFDNDNSSFTVYPRTAKRPPESGKQ